MSFRIQPMFGKVVRDPDSQPPGAILEAAGIIIPKITPHWLRRKNEGGVVITREVEDHPAPPISVVTGDAPDRLLPSGIISERFPVRDVKI